MASFERVEFFFLSVVCFLCLTAQCSLAARKIAESIQQDKNGNIIQSSDDKLCYLSAESRILAGYHLFRNEDGENAIRMKICWCNWMAGINIGVGTAGSCNEKIGHLQADYLTSITNGETFDRQICIWTNPQVFDDKIYPIASLTICPVLNVSESIINPILIKEFDIKHQQKPKTAKKKR